MTMLKFKMEQYYKKMGHLHDLKESYNSCAFYLEDKERDDFNLFNDTINILFRVDLVPNMIGITEYKNKPCVEFIYNIDELTNLHIRIQDNSYSRYRTYHGTKYLADSMYSGNNVVEWINKLTKKLLAQCINEYYCQSQNK